MNPKPITAEDVARIFRIPVRLLAGPSAVQIKRAKVRRRYYRRYERIRRQLEGL